MKIAIDYLLVFSHFWFATPQLVLQADWQEVWHSPQPPFLALSHRLRVSRVLILSIICISDLLNSNGFPGGLPAGSHLKTGKILAYHPHKVKIFQQFATNLPRFQLDRRCIPAFSSCKKRYPIPTDSHPFPTHALI